MEKSGWTRMKLAMILSPQILLSLHQQWRSRLSAVQGHSCFCLKSL